VPRTLRRNPVQLALLQLYVLGTEGLFTGIANAMTRTGNCLPDSLELCAQSGTRSGTGESHRAGALHPRQYPCLPEAWGGVSPPVAFSRKLHQAPVEGSLAKALQCSPQGRRRVEVPAASWLQYT
jgi:hypothetical protein